MSRIVSLILLALTLAVAPPPAALAEVAPASAAVDDAAPAQQAALPVLLRRAVTVSDAVIRIGDLFDGSLARPEVAVARAPAPGESVMLDARWLSAVARSYGVNWRPSSRFDQIVVTRDSQLVSTDAIRAVLADSMAARGIDQAIGIQFDGVAPTLRLPVGVVPELAVQQLNVDPQSGRFNAVLVATAAGPVAGRVVLSGRIYTMTEVPVPVRRLLPGEILTEDDLRWTQVRAERLSNAVVTDPAAIVGLTPRRPIRAGEPVRINDLQVATVVKRGTMVTMMLETPQMIITTQGRAMEDGAEGDVVNVMNTSSNRVVKAIVVDPTTVAVAATPAAGN